MGIKKKLSINVLYRDCLPGTQCDDHCFLKKYYTIIEIEKINNSYKIYGILQKHSLGVIISLLSWNYAFY